MKVSGAKLANGLLTIELQREIPEEKKARAIRIEAEPHRARSHSRHGAPPDRGAPLLDQIARPP